MRISHANQLKHFHKSVVIVLAAVWAESEIVRTNRQHYCKVRTPAIGSVKEEEEEEQRREAAAPDSVMGRVGLRSALRTCRSLATLVALKSLFFRTDLVVLVLKHNKKELSKISFIKKGCIRVPL